MIKSIHIDNLIGCPVCGNAGQLQRNAGKQFRVACTVCNTRTDWTQKAQAVANWYNMHFQIQAARFFKSQPQFTFRGEKVE